MNIDFLSSRSFSEYSDFIERFPEALLYHSLTYRSFLEKLLGCESKYLVAYEGDRIVGTLPLMAKGGDFGLVYNSLPFYGSNGGVLSSNKLVAEKLALFYEDFLAQQDVASATVVENPLNPLAENLFSSDVLDLRIGQWTLLADVGKIGDTLLAKFDSSARRNIRKAVKSGVFVEVDNKAIDFLKQTHIENMRLIGGQSKREEFFSLLGECFKPGSEYNVYVAKKDGENIAALLLFYFNKTVEYFMPVVMDSARTYQGLSLIIFQAMLDAAQKNYQWWNWGGTWLTQDGVYKFKKKWGAIDKPYRYLTKIINSNLYTASKQTLLAQYENFFVIPFSLLEKKEVEDEM